MSKVLKATVLLISVFAAFFSIFFLRGGPGKVSAAAFSPTLFLPGTKEEYLPLENPTDMAMNGSYIAIADGDALYIFDRAAEKYERFSHAGGASISKVQFTGNGRLFFSDQSARLYEYDFSRKQEVLQNNMPCSTFVIDGDMLYTAVVTNSGTLFYAIPHSQGALSLERAQRLGEAITSTSSPRMFVYEGTVYCAVNSYVHAYTYSRDEEKYIYTSHLLAGNTPVTELTSVCVFENELYYSVNGSYSGDGIYLTELNEKSKPMLLGKGFAALSACEGRLFAVESGAVRELKRDENGGLSYTGYEISASSASPHRLSGATETVRARDLLAIFDKGNARLVFYRFKENTFSSVPCAAAELLATDGDVVAVSNGQEISLYREGEAESFYTHAASARVTGIAVIGGVCYYSAENNVCGKAERGAAETVRKTPILALSGDLFGNLYAVDGSGKPARFSREEFFDKFSEGTPLRFTLPSGFTSLRADFEGNLYYLLQGKLYKNGEEIAPLPGDGLVFLKEGETRGAVSFALGFEDNELYVQYGNYMARMEADVSNLKQIAAGEVFDGLLRTPQKETLAFSEIPANVFGIGVDLTAIGKESEYFETTEYFSGEGGRGVKLGETGRYTLVALYHDHIYTPTLFLTADCTNLTPDWREQEPCTRYLSSEVGLYRFPCIGEGLEMLRLERGRKVTVYAEIPAGPDAGFDFAYAELSDGTRGYVPLGYLSESMPAPTEPERYFLAYLKANSDGVTFRSESGDTITVTERTKVRVYDLGDGRCFIRMEKDGVEYTGQATRSMLESGNPNALRISLIVFFCILALGIIAAYAILVPKKKRT